VLIRALPDGIYVPSWAVHNQFVGVALSSFEKILRAI